MKYWLALAIAFSCTTGAAMAWDGKWTQARDGSQGALYDKGVKQTDAGTPERPQTFFNPPERYFWDVDPEELGEYKKKRYSPYALARIEQDIRYNGLLIPKGYYEIKPGDANDGSPRINLKTQPATAYLRAPQPAATSTMPLQNPAQARPMPINPADPAMRQSVPDAPAVRSTGSQRLPSEDMGMFRITPDEAGIKPIADTPIDMRPSGMTAPGFMPPLSDTPRPNAVMVPKNPPQSLPPVEGMAPAPQASASGDEEEQEVPRYNVFVLKKLGKVIAVIPINRMEAYKPSRKEHIPKKALAWVEMENNHPVLKFYYKKRVYSSDCQ